MIHVPAVRANSKDLVYGVAVPDPYRWLENPDDPKTQRWMRQQEILWHSFRSHPAAREYFAAHVTADVTQPAAAAKKTVGRHQFYCRRTADQERAVLVEETYGIQRVLFDPVQRDSSGRTSLDHWEISPRGKYFCVWVSEGGTEDSILEIRDAKSGKLVLPPMDRVGFCPLVWLPDDSGFYYGRRLPEHMVPSAERSFHRRIYFHAMGMSAAGGDPEVLGKGRSPFEYHGLSVSPDGKWLAVAASRGTKSDLYLLRQKRGFGRVGAGLGTGSLWDVCTVLENVAGRVEATFVKMKGNRNYMYILTDAGHPNGCLLGLDPDTFTGSPGQLRTILPERQEAVLASYMISQDGFVVKWTWAGRTQIGLCNFKGEFVKEIPLPYLGRASLAPGSGLTTGGVDLFFSSFVEPGRRYSVDTTSCTLKAVDAPELLPASGERQTRATEIRWFQVRSKDGSEVPVFLFRRTDQPTGPSPTLLRGYGGFGQGVEPGFEPDARAWVDAGGTVAMAAIRGGNEKGDSWHREGTGVQKQNTFDDFIAVAEELIRSGVTTSDQLGISGASNGGLLVMAVATQRPELFAAVDCVVPLCDMIRYEQMGLGGGWREEYGSIGDERQFRALLAYSPYHAVRKGVRYPAVLLSSADGDARTDPAHARKMCAALQWATSSGRPVMLRQEAGAGHLAGTVSAWVQQTTDRLAFMADALGLGIGLGPEHSAPDGFRGLAR